MPSANGGKGHSRWAPWADESCQQPAISGQHPATEDPRLSHEISSLAPRRGLLTADHGSLSMRVIAGELKGRRLSVPKGKGVRPTSDYLREALFDILGSSIHGVRFLDLYAGSGAVGIEALSRGSAEVVFLEQDPGCLRVLRENLAIAGLGSKRVIAGDVLRVLPRLVRQGEGFDIIFLDPPYGAGLAGRTLEMVNSGDLLRPRGRVIVEHFAKNRLPPQVGSLQRRREKKHGQTMLTFYERTPEDHR